MSFFRRLAWLLIVLACVAHAHAQPAPATAAGLTQRVFGPNITLGTNWFSGGIQVPYLATDVTQNVDGSVTVGAHTGGAITTIQSATSPTNYSGTVWGGDQARYMEVTMSIGGGAINTAAGQWPAWWSNDLEIQATGTVTPASQWQGQGQNYGNWIENDLAEFAAGGQNACTGNALHNWYGTIGSNLQTNTNFGGACVPSGQTINTSHRYGFLWTPATTTTQGSAKYYVDDVLQNQVAWNKFNPATPPPPVYGSSAFSVMDARHLYQILSGSPANPITATAASVWQAPSASGTGQFVVANGKLSDPFGNNYIAHGIDIDSDALQFAIQDAAARPLTTLFPHINFIRVPVRPTTNVGTASATYPSAASFQSLISTATALHIVLEFEDHSSNGGQWECFISGPEACQPSNPPTGGALTTMLNYWSGFAQLYKANPYVWIGSLNEINSADGTYGLSAIGTITTYQDALYKAIRGTGNNNIIQMGNGVGGGNPGTVGINSGQIASLIANWRNITWYMHSYYDNGTPAGALAQVQGSTAACCGGSGGSGYIGAQTLRSADGVVPVIFDEFGAKSGNQNATDATSIASAMNTVQGLGVGSAGWSWYTSDQWHMVNNGFLTAGPFSLTTWGQEQAAVIANWPAPPGGSVTAETLAVGTIAAVPQATAFTVSGTIANAAVAPSLQYSDNGGAWQALPAGATITASTFSFSHPGVAANIAETVSVRDANNNSISATSPPFVVKAPESTNNTVVLPSTTIVVANFSDVFATLPLHRTWQSGDNWQLVAPDTPDGRGGPSFGESGDQWWVNPLNPSTPISGIYVRDSAGLHLGLITTPPAQQAYINTQAGAAMPYVGGLLNSSQTSYQKYGYWETTVAVPKVPGFTFQSDAENVQITGTWPPEIDLRIGTNAAGVQTVLFQFALGGGQYTQYTAPASLDPTVMHAYGWDWEAGSISFYIDRVQVASFANPSVAYQTSPMFLFLATAANYLANTSDPNPASLPVAATVQSVKVYPAFPASGTGPSAPIIDANGNVFVIVGGQISINGTIDPPTSSVIELAYVNHVLWQKNTSGNWYNYLGTPGSYGGPTTTSPLTGTAESLAVGTIAGQPANAAFTVSGTIGNVSVAPSLQYQDNTGAWQALPAGASVTASTFSFSHPGLVAGQYTVSVRDANATTIAATSNAFAVSAPAGEAITVGAIGSQTAGVGFSVSGTIANAPIGGGGTPPAPAAAAGFNVQTFGPAIKVGFTPDPLTSYPQFINGANWVPFTFYGNSWTTSACDVVTNADGSVTVSGPQQHDGECLSSAAAGNGNFTHDPKVFTGQTFGGGAYFQAQMKGAAGGPMAFWANDIETMNGVSVGGGVNPWAQVSSPNFPNYGSWLETDFAEFDDPNSYGIAVHHWYGVCACGAGIQTQTNTQFSKVAFPPAQTPNYTQYHNYGALWLPATANTQGSLTYYFDDQPVSKVTWNKYNPAIGPPPVDNTSYDQNIVFPSVQPGGGSDSAYAIMDTLHLALILGGAPSAPVTFGAVQVWQATGANDLPVVNIASGGAPSLQYQDNAGAWQPLPAGAVVTATTFTFPHPAMSQTSSGVVAVRDAANPTVVGTSNTFTVNAAATETLSIAAIPTQHASAGFAVTGSIGNTSVAPNLQYSDSGGAWQALPAGAVVTTSGFSFTHPPMTAAASATVAVRDANAITVTAVSNSFVVLLSESANNTIVTTVGPLVVDATGEAFALTASAQVSVNGVVDTTTASVVALAYVNHLVWQETNTGAWRSKAISTAAWSAPTQTSPLPPETLGINTIAPQTVGVAIAVTGTIANALTAPSLQYSVSGGPWVGFPVGAQVSNAAYSLTVPAIATVGQATIAIRDATKTTITATSNSFAVAAAPLEQLAFANIANQALSVAFRVTGTIANAATIPTLQYNVNGGSWLALPTGSPASLVTQTSFAFTVPAIGVSGTTTIGIRDANATAITATSNSFQVGTPVGEALSLNPVLTQVAGQAFTAQGTIVNATTIPTLQYAVNGGSWLAFPAGSSVTQTTFSLAVPAQAAGSETISVRDANATAITATSNSFQVLPAGVEAITITPIGAQQNGVAFSVAGSIANISSAPPLQYSDNGGAWQPLPAGASVTATNFIFVHPGLGASPSVTVAVRDAANPSVVGTTLPFGVFARESPNLSIITTVGPQIIDAAGNVWALSTTGQVALNARAQANTSNVIEVAYVNRQIWYENKDLNWWVYSVTGAWNPTGGTALGPLPSSKANIYLTRTAKLAVVTGFTVAVPGVVVNDTVVGGAFSLLVTSTDGTVAMPGATGSGTYRMTQTGSLGVINQSLAGLQFTGRAIGSGSILVTITDPAASTATATIPITVVRAAAVIPPG